MSAVRLSDARAPAPERHLQLRVGRSRFLPRTIAVLLAIDGLAYLIYSFAQILTPGFAAGLVPWIQLPAPLGEGALSLWLLLRGVNTQRLVGTTGTRVRGPSQQVQT